MKDARVEIQVKKIAVVFGLEYIVTTILITIRKHLFFFKLEIAKYKNSLFSSGYPYFIIFTIMQ